MLKRISFVTVCLIAAVGLNFWIMAQTPQDQDKPLPIDKKRFMQRKVASASKLLESLAVENYEAIKQHSQDLLLLSQESNWNTIQTPEYVEYSREFRLVASRLRDTADERNLDAATLGYIELTMSCVRCHKHLRSGSK